MNGQRHLAAIAENFSAHSNMSDRYTGSSPLKSPLNSSPSDLMRIKEEPMSPSSKLNSINMKNHSRPALNQKFSESQRGLPGSPDGGLKSLPKIPKIKRENAPSKSGESIPKEKKIKKESEKPRAAPAPKQEEDSDDEPLNIRLNKVKKEKEKLKVKEKERQTEKVKEKMKEKEKEKLKEKVKEKHKVKKEDKVVGKKRRKSDEEDDDDDFKYDKKAKIKKEGNKEKKKVGDSKKKGKEEKGKRKVKEEEHEVWKWWEEEPLPEGVKWLKLDHEGPWFPPPYERMPAEIQFYYEGEPMLLSEDAEEIATFYAKMLDHDYTQKKIFNENFFHDWRKAMTAEERKKIKDLSKCDFSKMHAYFKEKQEERKNMSKEEKQKIKEENERLTEKFGFCMMDGHRQKVGNFKIEPPGLFRGRGDHPKQGKVKLRVQPEDVIINIGSDANVPQPPEGHKWKAVQHDNKVTWLACWIENIANSYKYVMLNSATKLKGEKDWQKYETARKLKTCVDKIRADYTRDLKSKEMRVRQRAVALYFIDRLALRAGHEKEEGESADTVGCCSLRVEHITLHEEIDGQEFVVEFDFLGKDSIRYTNKVPVEKRVFKNLKLFMDGKQKGDDLFDRLSTTSLNKYLSELMEGLTAKVFRTYNASKTLQEQLQALTNDDDNAASKLLSYNRANRAVAILCNHQRAAPKTFDKQMENLMNKISQKKQEIKGCKKELKELKSQQKETKSTKTAAHVDRKKNQIKRLEEQLLKLEVSMTDKEENKEIALGTSKLNYLDPRISIAWCKKNDVPIEKVYNKTQRQKFQWAIDMTDEDFEF